MPRRRCVGCGRIAPKSELLRIALTDKRSAVHDRDGTMPGRGAYLCHNPVDAVGGDPELPAPGCLARAMSRGGIARALRSAATLDPKLVESVRMSVAKPDEGRLAETGTDSVDTRYAGIPESASAEGACHPASVGPLAISRS